MTNKKRKIIGSKLSNKEKKTIFGDWRCGFKINPFNSIMEEQLVNLAKQIGK